MWAAHLLAGLYWAKAVVDGLPRVLGSTAVFRAFAGFSLWVPLSLAFLAVGYWLLAAQDVRLRPFTLLGVAISAAFSVVAATCFIYPAAIGAVVATMLFVVSWMRNEG